MAKISIKETARIAQLLKKSLEHQLSPAEQAELHQWSISDPAYQALLYRMGDGYVLEELLLLWHKLERHDAQNYTDKLQTDVYFRITALEETKLAQIPNKATNKSRRSMHIRGWLPYVAAAVLLALSISTFYFWHDAQPASQKLIAVHEGNAAAAGVNRATLTFDNGKSVDLSETKTGIILKEGSIDYYDGTSLNTLPSLVNQDVHAMLQLTIPKGATYRVTLSDGSEVWLNSESVFRYPLKFNNLHRNVELEGEGYFSISSKKSQPFTVVSEGQEVTVLGTEFNVSAYPNDDEKQTTLVEGALKVKNLKTEVSNRLQPGEQTTVRGMSIKQLNVDVDQYIAWKNGFFYFDGQSPKEAFKKLSRWYDIDIVYKPIVPAVKFHGRIERNTILAELLDILESAGFEFEVDYSGGRVKIIVGRDT